MLTLMSFIYVCVYSNDSVAFSNVALSSYTVGHGRLGDEVKNLDITAYFALGFA